MYTKVYSTFSLLLSSTIKKNYYSVDCKHSYMYMYLFSNCMIIFYGLSVVDVHVHVHIYSTQCHKYVMVPVTMIPLTECEPECYH